MSIFGVHSFIVLEAKATITYISEYCDIQFPLDVTTGHELNSAPPQAPGILTARNDTCGFVYKTTVTVCTLKKKKKVTIS